MTIDVFVTLGNIGNKTFKEYLFWSENVSKVLFTSQKTLKSPFGTKMPQVQVLSPRPNKNESYDTIGIATFVLFFLSKMPVAQGFSAMGHKRIVSLCHSPALISALFRGGLPPCSTAKIHNETFLKRIISL